MINKCHINLLLFLFSISPCLQAQEVVAKDKKNHALTLLIGHAQISQGVQENGKNKWLSLPSWSLNYNYFFKSNMAIGVHSDIIIEDFLVEEHLKSSSSQLLRRSYPISLALVSTYKPSKHFSFLIGFGGEFANSVNLFLARIGLDYGLHIGKALELSASLTNDLKFNAYNSWNIGFGITKHF